MVKTIANQFITPFSFIMLSPEGVKPLIFMHPDQYYHYILILKSPNILTQRVMHLNVEMNLAISTAVSHCLPDLAHLDTGRRSKESRRS